MSMPFYVSPEQLMKDRADYARKGIARGRSVVVVQYADGVLFVSENPSQALHKVSEIYDRIAFAAVGRYNEFENLRIAGVRLADMRGYSYDRRDVTCRGLANAYAQTLGTIFSSGGEKPYEVELFVAEIGDGPAGRPDLPPHLRRPGRRRPALRRDGRRRRHRGGVPRGAPHRRCLARGRRTPGRRRRWVTPRRATGSSPTTTSRSPSSTAPAAGRASSAGSCPSRLRELLGERGPTEPNPEPEVEHTVPPPGPGEPALTVVRATTTLRSPRRAEPLSASGPPALRALQRLGTCRDPRSSRDPSRLTPAGRRPARWGEGRRRRRPRGSARRRGAWRGSRGSPSSLSET